MSFLRPPRSIRLKIGLVFGGTFFLGFAGAAFYVFNQVRQVLIQQENRVLSGRATQLAERTSVYPLVIPLPERGEVLSMQYTSGKITRRIYQSPSFQLPPPLRPPAPSIQLQRER